MAPTRLLTQTLTALLLLAALSAPSALAAEGVGPGKALGGTKTTSSASTSGTTSTTSGTTKTTGGSKEVLTLSTLAPVSGTTVSGTIAWEVGVTAGSPSKVEFLVDGSAMFTDSSSPYSGSLDTTKLVNGNHTLSATAYGSRGVKATTSVTVKVSNAASAPAPEPGPTPEPTPEPLPGAGSSGPVYWGATVGNQFTGTPAPWDMTALTKFEETADRAPSLVHFFQPWANCGSSCSFYNFPWTPVENVRKNGSIPVISWDSESIPSNVNESDFQLSDIVAGRYDTYIREWAGKAKQWGHPFFLRFDWEMNGNWFPWSEGVNGNQPGEFVAAWRHVHDIFTAVGATNATWVWCPNVSWNGSFSNFQQATSKQYPGDAYVDWTGLDGYNWGTNPARPGKWQSFDELYRASYRYLVETVAPSKPMMIGEIASSEYGGSKAAWIKDLLAKVPTEYTKIRALLWFDKFDSSMDWPVETSGTASSAFAEGIKNSAYVGNTFGSLSVNTIQPLS